MTQVNYSSPSRSPVALGRPCNANAYAPTIRNRTSAATNARNRSTKSGFTRRFSVQLPLFLTECPDEQHALFVRNLTPVFEVVAVSFPGGTKSSNRGARPRRSAVVSHTSIIARIRERRARR